MMRVSLILFFTILLSCASEQTKSNEEPAPRLEKETNSTTEVMEMDSATAERVRKMQVGMWPRLSHEKAVGFLEEYVAEFDAEHSGEGATMVDITTDFGTIRVKLYEDTPIHRANFLYLIERNYFNPTQIVRVVDDFVIQGGNSEEKEDQEKRFLIGEYNLPQEMRRNHLHFSGALAMSRKYEDNPEKDSAPYDFYIVEGKPASNAELFKASKKNGIEYTEEEKERYRNEGGAPHLDGDHTVFGEVVSGMEVVRKIASVETDASEWPVKEIRVEMEVVQAE